MFKLINVSLDSCIGIIGEWNISSFVNEVFKLAPIVNNLIIPPIELLQSCQYGWLNKLLL